jgi:trimethylamine--corrinoid protein Co-methyltransferase
MLERMEVLSANELKGIHESSLDILEQIGIKVYSDEGLHLLSDGGAEVDLKEKIARIPRALVEEMISKARRCEHLYGRDPKQVLELSRGDTYVMTGSTAITVSDIETGEIRSSTKRDIEESAKVVDALENVHIYCGMAEALDSPSEVMRLERFEAAVSNTTKHVAIGLLGGKEAKYIAKMGAAVAGGEEEYRKRPIVSQVECPVAPLMHYGPNTEAVIEGARNGTPIMILSYAESGMTAPISLAGGMAASNANGLAGLLTAWLANPEAPLIYHVQVDGPVLTKTFSTRSKIQLGAGTVEAGLGNIIGTQLARYYRFPNVTGLGIGDVIYGGVESFLFLVNGALSALARPDIMYGSGGGVGTDLSCSLLSYEQLILGNDVAGMFLRMLRGIDASRGTLDTSMAELKKVGPEGHFMTRESIEGLTKEWYIPKVLDAVEPGRIIETAKERAKKILAAHQVKPLSNEIKAQLRTIIDEAR